jgi:deoxyribose-phosphate aldolase
VNVASHIEHTNLAPTITSNDVDRLVHEASRYNFLGVCVPPFWVTRARREIGSRPIVLVTVCGFPMGYHMTETKLHEIELSLDNGADEIDMVWNISSFKSNLPWTKIELAKCSNFIHERRKILKIIIETAYLTDLEIISACKICADAGIDFVKTSTGLAPEGARVEHIELMKKNLPATVGIKASGGIKTYEQALALIEAGATRIGTSSGIHILASANTKS